MNTHAHLCDGAASQLEMVKSDDTGGYAIERSRWQNFHLLPLCRAIIVLFDELVPPLTKINNEMNREILLNDELRRQSAVLVLTGYDQGLSSAIDFDTIRAESLPLARRDVSATDGANMIRVPLKTAVQFIAELQQREERAFSGSQRNSTETTVNEADEYAENILANPTEKCSWSAIRNAFEALDWNQRANWNPEQDFSHWSPTMI